MNDRIQAIADAAARLFIRQGYARTQISHIAKAVGVSVGTIYLDFAGKKEILHYILQCTLDPAFAGRELERPITDASFPGLEQAIADAFERSARDFAAHLANHAARYSFEALLSDAFDLLSRYAAGCLFIEKNQVDFPALAAHYRTYRAEFLETVQQYLRLFIENGTVRAVEDPELVTVLIVELLSWWAMDMRYAAYETRELAPELAKRVCMENLLAAYRR